MRSVLLAGFLLIGAILLVCVRAIRIDDPGASLPVGAPPPDAQIAKPVSVQPAGSTAKPPKRARVPPSRDGSSTRSDLKAKFDAHIRRAENGDAASMLIIAEITWTCAPVGPYKSWNQYMDSPGRLTEWEQNFSPEELDFSKAWFDRLATDCRDINTHVPTGGPGQFARWTLYWYQKAAAAGNPTAQLFLISGNPPSEENRRSMAVLLKDAMAAPDYKSFELAAVFFWKYPAQGSDSSDVVRETWSYLACLHRKECIASEIRDSFDTQYSPAEVTAILDAAELLEHGGTTNVDFLSSSAFEPGRELDVQVGQ